MNQTLEISSLQHDIIRHAYDNVVERCARLLSFAMSRPIDSEIADISEKQINLAIDDLITFAVNGRRLIENTNLKWEFRHVRIPLWKVELNQGSVICSGTSEAIRIWKLLGVIIHNDFVQIVRSDFDVKVFIDPISAAVEISNQGSNEISPAKLVVRSDEFKGMMIDIKDLISIFESEVLGKVIDRCSKDCLYLESDYR